MSYVSTSASEPPYFNLHAGMPNVIDAPTVVAAQKGTDWFAQLTTRGSYISANNVIDADPGRTLARAAPLPIVLDDVVLLPTGKGSNEFTVSKAARKEPAALLISQTNREITSVTFLDTSYPSPTEVVCRANKYQIIPPQPDGTSEETLRRHAKFPQTVGQVKGTIEKGRVTIMDVEVNAEERGNGLGRGLVERINIIGAERGATCQVAKNLFDIEAGNSVGPKKFWTSLGYTVKKQGDYLNAYRGDCSELQPRKPPKPR